MERAVGPPTLVPCGLLEEIGVNLRKLASRKMPNHSPKCVGININPNDAYIECDRCLLMMSSKALISLAQIGRQENVNYRSN